MQRRARQATRQSVQALAAQKVTRAIYSERQLEEVLVDFWFNHFNVFAGKGRTAGYIPDYEREAIRPHVGGHFADMLLASSKHPAMILYLDNNLSVKPGFTGPPNAGPNAPRLTGLNENLAREILELHTLGVNGGYTQADVTTFARVLTGWTVGGPANPGFAFVPRRHDPGPKTILGKTYAQEVVNTAVRVNLLDPGPMRTGLRAKAFPGEDKAHLAEPDAVAAFALPLLLPTAKENGTVVRYRAAASSAANSLAASNDA